MSTSARRVAYMSETSILRRSGGTDLGKIETLVLRGSNSIGRLGRLENICSLTSLWSLDVSNNLLTTLAPFSAPGVPAIMTLHASGNQITSLDGLQALKGSLRDLDLTANLIEHLPEWVGDMLRLERLALAHNKLKELDELKSLRVLSQLACLSIAGNPLATAPQARLFAAHCCRSLQQLDGSAVSLDEVQEAATRFDETHADKLLCEIKQLSERLSRAETGAAKEANLRQAAEEMTSVEARRRIAALARVKELENALAAERRRADGLACELRGARRQLAFVRQTGYEQQLAAASDADEPLACFSAVAPACLTMDKRADDANEPALNVYSPPSTPPDTTIQHMGRAASKAADAVEPRTTSGGCARLAGSKGRPAVCARRRRTAIASKASPASPATCASDTSLVADVATTVGRQVVKGVVRKLEWGDSSSSGQGDWDCKDAPRAACYSDASGAQGPCQPSAAGESDPSAAAAQVAILHPGSHVKAEAVAEKEAEKEAKAEAEKLELEAEMKAEDVLSVQYNEVASVGHTQELECSVLRLQAEVERLRAELAVSAEPRASSMSIDPGPVQRAQTRSHPMVNIRDGPKGRVADEEQDREVLCLGTLVGNQGALASVAEAGEGSPPAWPSDRVEQLARCVYLARPRVEASSQTEQTVESIAQEEAAVLSAAAAAERAIAAADAARREAEAEAIRELERATNARDEADAALGALNDAEARYADEARRIESSWKARYAKLEEAAQAEADGAAGLLAERKALDTRLHAAAEQLHALNAGYELSQAMNASKDQQIAALQMLLNQR